MEHKSPIRKLRKEELTEILVAHREWLESSGKKGQKANLCDVDLSGLDLHEADFRRADLGGVNFGEVNLIETRLEEAYLKEADLTKAIGIMPSQFAAANVCGAKLPDEFSWNEGLKYADELSKKVGKLFFLMLAVCAYSLLTIATTTDAKLITNSPTSALPFVNSQIPIVYFYVAVPPALLGFFIWFHLYLIRLWEILSTLPAIFPDGTPLDKKVYPWLPIGMVHSYSFSLKNSKQLIFYRIQRWLTIISIWIVLPVTLFLMWFMYLKRQDLWLSYFQGVLFILAIAFACSFYHQMKNILGDQKRLYYFINYKRPWRILSLIGFGYIIYLISFSSILDNYTFDKEIHIKKKLVPGLLMILRLPRTADISGQQVSIKFSTEDKPTSVQGAQLRNRNLRYCRAFRSFLANADLRFSNLHNAYLSEANLRWANLRRSYMQKCYFVGADLRESDLSLAYLKDADLSEADCKKASFCFSNLKKAIMVRTNLEEANLRNANMEEVVLFGANLKNADLRKSNLKRANLGGFRPARIRLSDYTDYFGSQVMHEIIEDFPEGIIMEKKYWMNFEESVNLQESNLQEADLSDAKIIGANMKGANLTKTNLKGSDLTGVRGLTLEQIKSAIVDEKTKLPDYLK